MFMVMVNSVNYPQLFVIFLTSTDSRATVRSESVLNKHLLRERRDNGGRTRQTDKANESIDSGG